MIRSNKANSRRGGHTLMEMVVTLPLLTMLFAGMAAAIGLASRVAPHTSTGVGRTLQAAAAWDLLAQDLRSATAFPTRTANLVVCTVPDCTGDGVADTIRYEWSAIAGAPLNRQINGGSVEAVATDVHAFALNYVQRGSPAVALCNVEVQLQIGSGPGTVWNATLATLNQPVVASP